MSIAQLDSRESVCQAFVTAVRRLPQSRLVATRADGDELHVWTVIEAAPFERTPRDEVFRAEIEALGGSPEVLVDFHLANVAEHGSSSPRDLVPSDAHVVWAR
jgi:hypothetical protein